MGSETGGSAEDSTSRRKEDRCQKGGGEEGCCKESGSKGSSEGGGEGDCGEEASEKGGEQPGSLRSGRSVVGSLTTAQNPQLVWNPVSWQHRSNNSSTCRVNLIPRLPTGLRSE